MLVKVLLCADVSIQKNLHFVMAVIALYKELIEADPLVIKDLRLAKERKIAIIINASFESFL